MTPSILSAAELHPLAQEASKQLSDPEKPFYLIVELKVAKDKGQALIDAFKEPVRMTRKEKGNLYYALSRNPKSPETFMVYEHWKSLKDLDSHLKQPYLTKLGGAFEGILAGPPKLTIHVPVAEPKE